MNDELDLSIGSEVGAGDAVFVLGHQRLTFAGIVFRVQKELRVDDVAGQREDVEGPMDEVIPLPRDVEAADLAIAARLVFNWTGRETRETLLAIIPEICIEFQLASSSFASPSE